MGMYDTIKIERQLPLPEEVKDLNINWFDIEYQTKSFDNCLSEFILKDTGELFEVLIEREYIQWTQEEKKTAPKWSLFKDVIEKNREEKKLDYHGVVRFYCSENFDEENSFFIDFDAYFIYGKLDKIEMSQFKKYKVNRNSLREILDENNKFKNRFKRFILKYSGWNFFWKFIIKFIGKIIHILEDIKRFIYLHLL